MEEEVHLQTPDVCRIIRPKNKGVLVLALDNTKYAESRISDLERVSPSSLAEMVTAFTQAYLELSRAISLLDSDIAELEGEMSYRRAYILVNEMQAFMASKNLKSSEDMREAIIELDPVYSQTKSKSIELKNIRDSLKSRMKTIEMGYYSSQNIAKIRSSQVGNFRVNGSDDTEHLESGQILNGRRLYRKT